MTNVKGLISAVSCRYVTLNLDKYLEEYSRETCCDKTSCDGLWDMSRLYLHLEHFSRTPFRF